MLVPAQHPTGVGEIETRATRPAAADADTSADEPAASTSLGREKRKGHGRLPASMYEAATNIAVHRQSLKVGGCCPHCRSGKLYALKEACAVPAYLRSADVLGHVLGLSAPALLALRQTTHSTCSCRGSGPKSDETAVAMLALAR